MNDASEPVAAAELRPDQIAVVAESLTQGVDLDFQILLADDEA
jgi:hypothetical protein